MTSAPSWTEALDERGHIDWERFPLPRFCVPIRLPFPRDTTNSWEQVINDRHEALAQSTLSTGYVPSCVDIVLVVVGPLIKPGHAYPPATPWRRRHRRQ